MRSREARIASALAAPIAFGSVRASCAKGADRRKRHLVLVAAVHARKHLPPADCTRDVLAKITRLIERSATRSPGARGVNAKFIQRNPFCDKVYRRLRGLAAKAPWPRAHGGTLMSRAELEETVATDQWWICAIDARRKVYADESEKDLEAFRLLIIAPMPLRERVRRYAPPIVQSARIVVGRKLKQASNPELALLYRSGRRRLTSVRSALRNETVERARKLAVIHRRELGVG